MFGPLYITFKLAIISTLILLVSGIPLAYFLTFANIRGKLFWEICTNMPLILPPSVLGFYLLLTVGPHSFLGRMIEYVFNVRLVFTFQGLVIGATIGSLPFMVNSLKTGFRLLPKNLIEAAYSLGKGKLETFYKVILPNSRPALLNGITLSFLHTMGSFGTVLMLGGNIPGETETASIAIYSEMESLNYGQAHFYSFILAASAFLALSCLYILNKQKKRGEVFL